MRLQSAHPALQSVLWWDWLGPVGCIGCAILSVPDLGFKRRCLSLPAAWEPYLGSSPGQSGGKWEIMRNRWAISTDTVLNYLSWAAQSMRGCWPQDIQMWKHEQTIMVRQDRINSSLYGMSGFFRLLGTKVWHLSLAGVKSDHRSAVRGTRRVCWWPSSFWITIAVRNILCIGKRQSNVIGDLGMDPLITSP